MQKLLDLGLIEFNEDKFMKKTELFKLYKFIKTDPCKKNTVFTLSKSFFRELKKYGLQNITRRVGGEKREVVVGVNVSNFELVRFLLLELYDMEIGFDTRI